MSEDVKPYNNDPGMWVHGWMLGKYEQKGRLPRSEEDAAEWYQGFVMGTVEACLYEQLQGHLERLLDGNVQVLSLVESYRQAGGRDGGHK